MKVIVVDSLEEEREHYAQALRSDYDVVCCGSRQRFFELFEPESESVVVVLDTCLDDGFGYQLCSEIKAQCKTTLVLFLANFDEHKDLMDAYHSGADDYVVKPVSAELLLTRVGLLEKSQQKLLQVQQQAEEAESLAFRSMKEISEYGMVLRMVRDSFSMASLDDIVSSFFQCIDEFQLGCSIQIRSKVGDVCKQNKALDSTSVEQKVFDALREKGRVYRFNERMIINFPKVSVLIKNLPQDEFDVGRYQDLFCLLVELLEEKIKGLEKDASIQDSQIMLKNVCQTISEKLDSSDSDSDISQLANVSETIEKMERAFDFMDLSQSEEVMFRELFDSYYREFESLSVFLTSVMRQLMKMQMQLKNS